mmetsp:Transcript_45592/g.83513  ORF Transcript_45592/g.83513 Transcript_45592/m.83513 type:complete len:215 (+) Transcript_45592:594-1238(+)
MTIALFVNAGYVCKFSAESSETVKESPLAWSKRSAIPQMNLEHVSSGRSTTASNTLKPNIIALRPGATSGSCKFCQHSGRLHLRLSHSWYASMSRSRSRSHPSPLCATMRAALASSAMSSAGAQASYVASASANSCNSWPSSDACPMKSWPSNSTFSDDSSTNPQISSPAPLQGLAPIASRAAAARVSSAAMRSVSQQASGVPPAIPTAQQSGR